MNHRYIDEHSVAERYLEHALPPAEHDAFEAHMVQCDECSDRLMLAQIFLDHKAIGIARGAAATSQPQATSAPAEATEIDSSSATPELAKATETSPTSSTERVWPKRAYFVTQFTPWQLFFLAVGAAFWLLAVPTAYFLGQLARLSGKH